VCYTAAVAITSRRLYNQASRQFCPLEDQTLHIHQRNLARLATQAAYRPADADLEPFMAETLTFYRQRGNR
jgi:hypothetical protein